MTYWCPKCEKFVDSVETYQSSRDELPYHILCGKDIDIVTSSLVDRLTVKRFINNQSILIFILLLSSIFDALRDCTISYPIDWWTWHSVKWISVFSVWIYLWLKIRIGNDQIIIWTWRIMIAITSYTLWETAYKLGPSILQ